MTHIIRQQYLHIEVNGTESDGLALQRSLPDLCQHWLMPAIERALDRCAPPDGHLYIERLEIDVGTLDIERLEHDLAESVAQTVETSLREQARPGESSPTSNSGNIQHKTAQQSVHDAFLYFLRTGSLPWSFRLPEGSNLEQVLLRSWQEPAKSGMSPRAMNAAILRMLASANVRKRLIRQFSLVFVETVLALLSPEGKQAMDGVLQVLHRADVPSVAKKYFEQHLWEAIFAKVAAANPLTSTSIVSAAWRALPVTAVGETALASLVEHHWPDAHNKAPPTDNRMKDPASIPPDNTELIPPNLPISEDTPIKISEHPEAREGIYIENAGVVLLHPFLPQFFMALGVANEGTLLQPERALCLLHFLTTGQLIAPEYELVLPKILCNIALATPVGSDQELTDAEKEEAMALLEAIIRHWDALRNTSPDGLRGTFLLRPGKVSLRDDGDWLLQVESKAYDILLEQLPWGISIIKLPWMEKMLWVEWG